MLANKERKHRLQTELAYHYLELCPVLQLTYTFSDRIIPISVIGWKDKLKFEVYPHSTRIMCNSEHVTVLYVHLFCSHIYCFKFNHTELSSQ